VVPTCGAIPRKETESLGANTEVARVNV